ncbi:MAG: PBSX family phage terminase large subunit, partial [Deltaproteobacteria bacterium]|nr:PBSX family phage terminase large subunit [Deltaproteobacteria bacterium]
MTLQVRFPPKLAPLFKPARYKVPWGGRDAGRSWGVARALLTVGASRTLRILCAREIQRTLADSVLALLRDQIKLLGLESFYSSDDSSVSGRNGTEFIFTGLRDLDANKIKSYEGVDIAWVEEAETLSKRSFNILDPTVRKEGSELWFTFNPQLDSDFIYDHFVANQAPGAVVIFMTYRDNPWASEVLAAGREHMRLTDREDYDNIWDGKVRTAVAGAIYATELRSAYESERVCEVEHDANVAVFTAWDIGHTDDTAIWWYQIVGGEIHVLEGYAKSGGTPSDFATQILGRKVQIDLVDGALKVTIGAELPELKHRLAYRYDTHWLPHDARAKTLAAH